MMPITFFDVDHYNTVKKFLDWLKGFGDDGNSNLDRPITLKFCGGEDCRTVRRSLLGYALSRGSPTMVAALMKEQASPFHAGYDPMAKPADLYVFDPFYYVVHNTMAFDKSDYDILFPAFEAAGLRPSRFARQQFEVLRNRSAATNGKCVLGPDEPELTACNWLEGFMPLYRMIECEAETGSINFALENRAPVPQVHGETETAIIEGRTQDDEPVFLQIWRPKNEPDPCPLRADPQEKNAGLFLVRASADNSSERSFDHYTGIWDGRDLCLRKKRSAKQLDLQAIDTAKPSF